MSEGRVIVRAAFRGEGADLFGLYVQNIFLSIVTLGVYWFWGMVRVRKYLYGQTEVDGSTFVYHGRGARLLISWLQAMVVLVVGGVLADVGWVAVLRRFPGLSVWIVASVAALCAVMGLGTALAIVVAKARSDRRNRTSWHSIQFADDKGLWDFIKLYVPGAVLTLLTLGFYYPVLHIKAWRLRFNGMSFGGQKFEFEGDPIQQIWPFARAVLLTPFTLGMCWAWYFAHRSRYDWGHTSVAGSHFRSTVTGKSLLFLQMKNTANLIGTLGLGYPWVKVRNIRFASDNLFFNSPAVVGGIDSPGVAASPVGEEPRFPRRGVLGVNPADGHTGGPAARRIGG